MEAGMKEQTWKKATNMVSRRRDRQFCLPTVCHTSCVCETCERQGRSMYAHLARLHTVFLEYIVVFFRAER